MNYLIPADEANSMECSIAELNAYWVISAYLRNRVKGHNYATILVPLHSITKEQTRETIDLLRNLGYNTTMSIVKRPDQFGYDTDFIQFRIETEAKDTSWLISWEG
jgi:hypothetical protein